MHQEDRYPAAILADPSLSYYQQVLRFIRSSVRDQEEAEDLAQETYLRYFRTRRTLHGKEANRLLHRIARHLLADRYRRWKTRTKAGFEEAEILEEARIESPTRALDHVIEAREEIRALEGAIAGLSARCRQIFLLHRFGGLTYSQIAKHLGISQSTVEKHITKAIVACRDALDAME
ncbi:MAG: RNA polymerase sigma factor [Verrucomicrobiota bacterium]